MLWSVLTLLLMLLLVGAALVVGVSLAMAKVLLSPPRMTGGRALWILRRLSPGDLGMPSEDLTFVVRDEHANRNLKLSAWWIPAAAPSGRCAILIHGYADSKLGGIAWAPTFRSMGYHVLAIDLRGHGESEGTQTTAGYFERYDVSQVIDQIRAQRPAVTREVVLFGVSLGAAVAGATAALRDDVAAVIMDSPYRDYPSAARTHGDNLGMPGPMFQTAAIALAQKLSGADLYECGPVRVIPTLRCPLMVIHGSADLFVAPEDMDAVEAATRSRPPEFGPTAYWRLDGTHHVLALRTDPDEFRRRVESFLDEARAARRTSNAIPAVAT